MNQTLNFQEKLRVGKATLAYTTDDLIDHYNCGDLNTVLFSTQTTRLANMNSNSTLKELEMQATRDIDKYFKTELIFKRNELMAKRVIDLLTKHPERNFFFAFGAGKCFINFLHQKQRLPLAASASCNILQCNCFPPKLSRKLLFRVK